MSRYEWERGSFTLPIKEFGKFRKALIDGWNNAQNADFEVLKKLHSAISAIIKEQCNIDLSAVIHKECCRTVSSEPWGWQTLQPLYKFQTIAGREVQKYLLNVHSSEEKNIQQINCSTVRLQTPRKSAFTPLTRKSSTITFNEASVSFDTKNHSVEWTVAESNHAIDRARKSFLGTLFFTWLRNVEWTHGTGGEIYGNDEYNCAEGGCIYIKESYGPNGTTTYI